MYPSVGMRGLRAYARWWLPRHAAVSLAGLEHQPRSGPVLLVARHYHHAIDGAVLLAQLPRPVHIVVALDWVRSAAERRRMERACRWAAWPVILRPARARNSAAYHPCETGAYLRRGLRDAAELLRAKRVVAIFPEGYPAVDAPGRAPPPASRDGTGLLPFSEGFRVIAQRAERIGGAAIPIVPFGLHYENANGCWRVRAAFGAPLSSETSTADVQRIVGELSTAG